jgi:hypothetical protein
VHAKHLFSSLCSGQIQLLQAIVLDIDRPRYSIHNIGAVQLVVVVVVVTFAAQVSDSHNLLCHPCKVIRPQVQATRILSLQDNNTHSFMSFPYVCPEPVLAK